MATDELVPLTVDHEIEQILRHISGIRNRMEADVEKRREVYREAQLRAAQAASALCGAERDLKKLADISDACQGEKRQRPPVSFAAKKRPRRYWSPEEVKRLHLCAKDVDRSLEGTEFYEALHAAFSPTSRSVAAVRYKAVTIKPSVFCTREMNAEEAPRNDWIVLAASFMDLWDGSECVLTDSKCVGYHLDLIERYYGRGLYAWFFKPRADIGRLREKIGQGSVVWLSPYDIFFLAEHFPGKWTAQRTVRSMHFGDDDDDAVEVKICKLEKRYLALEDTNEAYCEGALRKTGKHELAGVESYRTIVRGCGLNFWDGKSKRIDIVT